MATSADANSSPWPAQFMDRPPHEQTGPWKTKPYPWLGQITASISYGLPSTAHVQASTLSAQSRLWSVRSLATPGQANP